jgi:ubiquinone biosynthesis protein UbiJ
MFAQPSAAALNHLLTQNSWALPRLKSFAGKTARFNIAPFSFAYTILDNGLLNSADATTSADARCVIAPSLLPRLAAHDESAYAEINSEGDAALLAEIFFLSRNLRWNMAEDLSQITGDIAAERIVRTLKTAQRQLFDAAISLSQATAEYWTEERPLIAKSQPVSTFMQHVDILRNDMARLEQRIKRLASLHSSPSKENHS